MRVGLGWTSDGNEKEIVLLKEKADDGFIVINGVDEALKPVETKMDFFQAYKFNDMPVAWRKSNKDATDWMAGEKPDYKAKNGLLALGKNSQGDFKLIIVKSIIVEHKLTAIGSVPQKNIEYMGTVLGNIIDPYTEVIPIPDQLEITE